MNDLMAFCGLLCNSCPIYLTSRENDLSRKKEMVNAIIKSCKENYGIVYKYEDINDCDGCNSSGGRIFVGCSNCEIRVCVTNKGIDNCAHCNEYACENLLEVFKSDLAAKTRLDLIRDNLGN